MRRPALLLAVPAVLALAACGPSTHAIGDDVGISEGTVTVTAVDQGSQDDVADLELDELDGQTPYFVRYEVDLDDGVEDIDDAMWQGSASSGDVTPVNIIQIDGAFDCAGLGEVSDGQAEGCQLVMVEEGATLEWVAYGGAGRWTVE